MSNIAIIFAAGTGSRLKSKLLPKQFIELYDKPILVYTLEKFNSHPKIDNIILVTLESWIKYCSNIATKFNIHKMSAIVPGGPSALHSQFNGLAKAIELFDKNSIVLIHDGVRPLIDDPTINKNIESVKVYGSSVTVSPATETIIVKTENDKCGKIIDRSMVYLARAPQSFYLKDIWAVHQMKEKEGKDFIDSASMMQHYGYNLHFIEGPDNNIKITSLNDVHFLKSVLDNSRTLGE